MRSYKPLRKKIDARVRMAIVPLPTRAPVAELVDAVDSKSTFGNEVGVQVPPGVPFISWFPASHLAKLSNHPRVLVVPLQVPPVPQHVGGAHQSCYG